MGATLNSGNGEKPARKGDHVMSLPNLVPTKVLRDGPPLPLDRSTSAETLTSIYNAEPPPGISSADVLLAKPKGAQDYHITGKR